MPCVGVTVYDLLFSCHIQFLSFSLGAPLNKPNEQQ